MPAKSTLDPRQTMEQAVAVMRRSVREARLDHKASPLVGAVLVTADGAVETAYRGELREGEHAEFTLLERKSRAARLDGSILFTTLEPCAPGASHDPEMCCAERIVRARIKEVWVGIEDPDPTVDRTGIKYLQDHDVAVHMFDRELQEEIRAANQAFIDQALGRVVATGEGRPAPALSPLERPAPQADLRDLSREALEAYRAAAKVADPVDSEAFRRRLLQQGLLRDEEDRLVPSGFGVLLFGQAPRNLMRQAGLLGTIHFPDGREEMHDFDGPQVFAPEQALTWLRDKLPNPIDRSQAQRRQTNDALFELLREGIVNALVHRDYDLAGAKCQLVVTPDAVVVKSPGAPVPPVTLEHLQSFSAPMLSRNPLLHFVFAKMGLAEERGLGLKSMRTRATDAGLPLPKYSWDDPYLVLTLYRSAAGAANAVSRAALGGLSNMELMGWAFLSTRTSTTQGEYARHLGINARTAQRHLTHFVELGLLRRTGLARATKYQVIGP